ncbi:hypothetical protein PFISCL1PPCAC_15995, partial [Pristionchus fissidentatus]
SQTFDRTRERREGRQLLFPRQEGLNHTLYRAQMNSFRPTRRSLDSALSRLSQVSTSPSSSQESTSSSPFCSQARRRDSLDSLYSSFSSFCSYDTVTSPPTRWPTSRTPRRRRPYDGNQSILDTTVSSANESMTSSMHDESTVSQPIDDLDDSGFHDDIFASPPINKVALSQSSLLRTPTNDVLVQRSTNSHFSSAVSSPSPLRSFKIREVSHLSSNLPRGVATHMRFSGADVSHSKAVHIGQSQAALQQKHPKREDSPPPSTNREIKMETPSKGYEDNEEDPLFSMASSSMVRMRDIPEITSGPIESSLYPFMDNAFLPPMEGFSFDDEDFDGNDDSDEEEYTPTNHSPSPVRPSILQHSQSAAANAPAAAAAVVRQPLGDLQQNSLKRRAEDGWKSRQEIKKANYGVKRWEQSNIVEEDIKPDVTQLKSSMAAAVGSEGDGAADAAKSSTGFRTPKKPFKTYSKRWWNYCCGKGPEQRAMTAQAHTFLRRHGVTVTASMTAVPTTPAVVKNEEGSTFFDEDINFASYLTGIDTSYAAPEDPLNYQPPLLLY